MSSNTITFLEAIEATDGLGALQVSSNCAIGALLKHRGFSDEQIVAFDEDGTSDSMYARVFGLDEASENTCLISQIFRVNDYGAVIGEPERARRARMIQWVKEKIAELQQQ